MRGNYCLLLLSTCIIFANHTYAAILRVGNPLQWHASKPYLQSVRLSGVEQFINHYKRCQGIELPLFVWGDEIEYGVFRRNQHNHFDLAMNATKMRESLIQYEKKCADLPIGCEWQPEYGSWMVEAVPRSPYGSYVSDLLNVEKSMQLRRKRLHFVLQPNEIAPTTSNFPMLGVAGYEHGTEAGGPVANSQYLSDQVINPHPRFAALTRNIRMRRGSNVQIEIPKEVVINAGEKDTNTKTETINMDAMAFGMGCCCLQVTMQVRSEADSRYLHDQLLVLGPILQALSAATPIFKGELAGTDTRWEAIAQAVDDRTSSERSQPPSPATAADPDLAGGGIKPLQRSRYSSSCLYIAKPSSDEDEKRLAALNDLNVDVDDEVLTISKRQGLDSVIATHLAHLFTRDPLVIFDDAIVLDNQASLDHFENIQSTNWRSMRWKPPSLRLGLAHHQRKLQTQAKTTAIKKSATLADTDDSNQGKCNDSDRIGTDNAHRKDNQYKGIYDSGSEEGLLDPDFDFDPEDLDSVSEDEVDFDHNILVEDRDHFVLSPTDGHMTNNASANTHTHNNQNSGNGNNNSAGSNPKEEDDNEDDYEDLQSLGPGWRVEFRPLEVQLTDFENAAYAMFTVLLARSLLTQKHSLYLPMSLVEENMRRAQLKNAVQEQRFYFRRNCLSSWVHTAEPSLKNNIFNSNDCHDNIGDMKNSNSNNNKKNDCECDDGINSDNSFNDAQQQQPQQQQQLPPPPLLDELDIVELTIHEIINGESPDKFASNIDYDTNYKNNDTSEKKVLFPGLIPMVKQYMSSLGCDDTVTVTAALQPYLQLLQDRASGRLPTTAQYLRDFVHNHPEYVAHTQNQNTDGNTVNNSNARSTSRQMMYAKNVPPAVADALLQHCEDIGMGRCLAPRLYGDDRVPLHLDAIDEEDLMFVNSTCFVRPRNTVLHNATNHANSNSVNHKSILSASVMVSNSGDSSYNNNKSHINDSKSSTGNNSDEDAQPKSKRSMLMRKMKELWRLRPWRRVRRSRDDQLRF